MSVIVGKLLCPWTLYFPKQPTPQCLHAPAPANNWYIPGNNTIAIFSVGWFNAHFDKFSIENDMLLYTSKTTYYELE